MLANNHISQNRPPRRHGSTARCAERDSSRSPTLVAVGTGGVLAAPWLWGAPTEEAMLDFVDPRAKQQCDPLLPPRRCIDAPRPVLTIARCSLPRFQPSNNAPSQRGPAARTARPRQSNRGKHCHPPLYRPPSAHR